jgi:hypothetical protein
VGAAAALGNLATLHQGYRALANNSEVVRGGLTGLEVAADRVDPGFVLAPQNSDFNYFTLVKAGPYLSASEKFGSPAYSETELAEASDSARVAADKVSAAALPVSLQPEAALPKGSCRTVGGGGRGAAVVELPPGGVTLEPLGSTSASLRLRRYATGSFPVDLGPLRAAARLVVPTDRSSRPWQLRVDTSRPVAVCR